MIFPLSHERMTARRWPIVTTILFAACLLVQIVITQTGARGSGAEDVARQRALEYFAQHPYLHVQPGTVPGIDQETLDIAQAATRAMDLPDDDAVAGEQRRLDELLARAEATPPDDPARRFGYVPSRHNGLGLLTYTFVHGGWVHLAGNMWFLFFCGMTLEDRWGRVVFPLFYVGAGVAAALFHGLVVSHGDVPLIGASGAIAGCMGAFAVAFARTPVRFLFLLTLRPRTFLAPAWVVLGIWVLFEAAWGVIFPGDGTAHWAHVGGFAFGVVVGLVLHRTGLDRRLDDAVEVAAVLEGDPRIDEARLLLRRGQGDDALAMLEGLAIERPDSAVVHEAIVEVARALGNDERAQAAEKRAAMIRASA